MGFADLRLLITAGVESFDLNWNRVCKVYLCVISCKKDYLFEILLWKYRYLKYRFIEIAVSLHNYVLLFIIKIHEQ